MRAVSFDRYGPADVLRVVDVPEPRPQRGQVAIAVEFAGVNFAEVMARRGDWDLDLPHIPGLEVVGTVTKVGTGVGIGLRGTRAAAFTGSAGYAEVALADAAVLLPLDGINVPTAVAAAVPCTLPTAWGVLTEAGRLRAGEDVLVHAAAGGVGSVIGQLARHLGARRVVGVVGTEHKVHSARGLGCYDDVILRSGLPDTATRLIGRRGFDVICDSIGGPSRAQNLALLAPFGRLVVFGNATGDADPAFGLLDFQRSCRTVAGYNVAVVARDLPEIYRRHASDAIELLVRGVIEVEVSNVLRLEDAARAHSLLESGATTGKIVLSVARSPETCLKSARDLDIQLIHLYTLTLTGCR
jgi:NADPH2:quinone reductase